MPTLPPNIASYGNAGSFWNGFQTSQDVKTFTQPPFALCNPGMEKPVSSPSAVGGLIQTTNGSSHIGSNVLQTANPNNGHAGNNSAIAWHNRSIGTHKLRLLEYSAYVEQQRDADNSYHKHLFVDIGGPVSFAEPLLEPIDVRQIQDKFPEKKGGLKELYEKGPQDAFFLVKFWADLNTNISDEAASSFYNVTAAYESNESMTIQVSTKVCSFGRQVVEKLETEYAQLQNGRFLYKIARSPMCEYMINFIHKLKHLPEKYMMNSVLENFTILQVITNRDTRETLLCIAYVFEVSTSEHGAQHHIYRLTNE